MLRTSTRVMLSPESIRALTLCGVVSWVMATGAPARHHMSIPTLKYPGISSNPILTSERTASWTCDRFSATNNTGLL